MAQPSTLESLIESFVTTEKSPAEQVTQSIRCWHYRKQRKKEKKRKEKKKTCFWLWFICGICLKVWRILRFVASESDKLLLSTKLWCSGGSECHLCWFSSCEVLPRGAGVCYQEFFDLRFEFGLILCLRRLCIGSPSVGSGEQFSGAILRELL